MLSSVTTAARYFCIHNSTELLRLFALPTGTSVDVDSSLSYSQHDTAAQVASWMASNNLKSQDSLVLFHVPKNLGELDLPNPEYEELRVAVSLPTPEQDLEDIDDVEAAE